MINGAHVILYSKDAEADRAFLRDILKFPHVDVGHGWLIFGLPPSEVAVHPVEAGESESHELYLMCDDVKAVVKTMQEKKIACDELYQAPWGLLTSVVLPGGSKLGIYQPRHARPPVAKGPAKKSALAKKRKAPAKKSTSKKRR